MPKKNLHGRPIKKRKSLQSAAVLIDQLELKSIRIIESHSKLNIVGNGVLPEVENSVHAGFGMTDEGTVLANVTATVQSPAPKDGDTTPRSSFSITVVVQCVFVAADMPKKRLSISEEEQSAINYRSTFIAWPYIRSHIQAASMSMGLPPITLPLMKLQATPTVSSIR